MFGITTPEQSPSLYPKQGEMEQTESTRNWSDYIKVHRFWYIYFRDGRRYDRGRHGVGRLAVPELQRTLLSP